jgi:murein DD-endopeptidase MepM/ murein hydrolase activator NlpD
VQGGLLVARTAPGAAVTVDGRTVRVSPDGVFLVGFTRDAAPETRIVVTSPAGRRLERRVEVGRRTYRIQRIDGLPPRKVSPRPEDLERIRAEADLIRVARARDDARADFLSGFVWPVVGRVSGVYGSQRILNGEPRQPHFGVDIAVPEGTPVHAPAPGVVTLVHPDMFFSGVTLIVDHGHGLSSAFLHLARILVREGQHVEQGQDIAEVGATGRVTGAHLDWRVNLFDARIDPALLAGRMPEAVVSPR